ncbi:MAG: hypothetical protein HC942_30690, partial [Microcoleus sp. SU_5_6]|nr:hypothetical protein [Microcoleus sp. SU_5_6]
RGKKEEGKRKKNPPYPPQGGKKEEGRRKREEERFSLSPTLSLYHSPTSSIYSSPTQHSALGLESSFKNRQRLVQFAKSSTLLT